MKKGDMKVLTSESISQYFDPQSWNIDFFLLMYKYIRFKIKKIRGLVSKSRMKFQVAVGSIYTYIENAARRMRKPPKVKF